MNSTLREVFDRLLQEMDDYPSLAEGDTPGELVFGKHVNLELGRLTQGDSCWLHEATCGNKHLAEILEPLIADAAECLITTATHFWMTGESLPCRLVVDAMVESVEKMLKAHFAYISH